MSDVLNCDGMTAEQARAALRAHCRAQEAARKTERDKRAEHRRAVLGDKLPDVLTGRNGAAKQIGAGAGNVAGLAEQLKGLSKTERRQLAKLLKGGNK
jgi:hypothetical protein